MKNRTQEWHLWTNGNYGTDWIMYVCRLLKFIDVEYEIRDAEMINDYHMKVGIVISPHNKKESKNVSQIFWKAKGENNV